MMVDLDCPKHMVFGPCGGVRGDLNCELGDRPCPFASGPLVRWPEDDDAAPRRMARGGGVVPTVFTDLSVRPYDPSSLARIVAILAPTSDALLVGEHHNRPDFPPTQLAGLILDAGGRPWMTLTCRDRNRVVLEQEVAGLSAMQVPGVLCVTGDVRGGGVRPGVTQVFDLDSMRLASLAAKAGLNVAVAESPSAHPVADRPVRLADKQRAGASLAILNHVSEASAVAEFVAAVRRAGGSLPLVASVAIFTDRRSASVLQSFPGLHLDDEVVDTVLESSDPVQTGIDTAVAGARELLAIDGVSGVNISGLASGASLEVAAEIKAEVGRQLRHAF